MGGSAGQCGVVRIGFQIAITLLAGSRRGWGTMQSQASLARWPMVCAINNQEKPMRQTHLSKITMCSVAMLATVVGPAHAEVVVNDTANIEVSTFVSCAAGGAGEVVNLSGPLHTLISFNFTGNRVSGYFHFQPQGISGVGETTGTVYQGTGVTRESFNFSLQNGQFNVTFVNNFRIIGHGPGNNFLVHENLHFTFNADGTLTVFHDNFNVECK
jgi:hypothetical protein